MGDRYRGGRERDENPNVEYFGAGESYRPGGHSGSGPYRPPNRQPTDSWSSDRRDREKEREREPRREDIDSYVPSTSIRARPRSRSPPPRRRSRTPPPARGRADLFDDRPPGRLSPRRDERPRSPPRRRSRSPIGRRSPNSRRERNYSPDRRSPRRERSPERSYGRPRSPPRRGYSPSRGSGRGGYRSRSRTPPRKAAYNDDNWRRRSPSPRGGSSAAHSRRSSPPPVHPDRVSSVPRSPAYNSRYESRRDEPNDGHYDTDMTDDYQQNGSAAPPAGPRNGYDRPPPSGPSRGYNQSSQGGPPTGPSMSAHNRGGPGMVAPTRPRGGFGAPARDFTSPVRGRGSLTYRAPSAPRSTSYSESSPVAPPAGPRAGGFGRGDYSGRGDFGGGYRGDFAGRGGYGRGQESSFPFRGSNNSTSATYPRTQRFNTVQQHLSTLEKVVPGGKLLPTGLTPEQEVKLKKLEADAEKIRADLAEKQKAKREAVNEWEVREREVDREALRSELAEQNLQQLGEGEDGGMAAF